MLVSLVMRIALSNIFALNDMQADGRYLLGVMILYLTASIRHLHYHGTQVPCELVQRDPCFWVNVFVFEESMGHIAFTRTPYEVNVAILLMKFPLLPHHSNQCAWLCDSVELYPYFRIIKHSNESPTNWMLRYCWQYQPSFVTVTMILWKGNTNSLWLLVGC